MLLARRRVQSGYEGAWPWRENAVHRAGSGSLAGNDVDNPAAEDKRTDFETLRDIDLDRPVGTVSVLGLLARAFKY